MMVRSRSDAVRNRRGCLGAGCLLLALLLPRAAPTQQQAAVKPAADALPQRQQALQQRVQDLEGRMLTLSQLLSEAEPQQAERLRAALQELGQRDIRRRLDETRRLLADGRYSAAEQLQAAVVSDLERVLRVLTDTTDVLDRKRAERERLEQLKRNIRRLMQEQTGQLYRTEALKGDQAPRDAWQLLERAQRALSESADDLHEQMQPADDAEGPTPGRRQLESAQEAMRRAADRLGELQQDESEKAQRDVLAELQRSLAELDDALRQVRREEVAETLAALETRFRALLSRQEEIRRTVTALGAKSVEQWQRDDENALAAAATLQQQAAEDCRTIRRLLVNEGTTLVLPELTEEIAGDMAEVAAALQGADVGPVPRARIDEIIALLQEVLDAIAQQREQQAEEPPPTPPGQQAPPGGSGALLPASTELKLLRSAQVRINNQTTTLAEQAEGEPVRQRRLETLAQRQQRLAELAWQLVERK